MARASTTIEVDDAIAFKGKRRNIWYTVGRPVTVAHGMVTLEIGAQVVEAHPGQGAVVASAVTREDDVLPGEEKDPKEIVRGLIIPCEALTLDGPGSVVLRAEPRANAPAVSFTTTIDGQRFSFERIAEAGPWMGGTRSGAAARVTGWTRRADLEVADGPEGTSGGCSGDHGAGLSGRGWGGKPPVTLYKGPAKLRVGAKLDFGEWSATVQRPPGFEIWVYEFGGQQHVEVTAIPGVTVRGPSGPSARLEDVLEYLQPKVGIAR